MNALRRISLLLVSATLAVLTASAAHARGLAFDVPNTQGWGEGGGYGNYGYSFTVNQTVTVDGLSYMEVEGTALQYSHAVGLWNSSGSSLIASTVVTNSDPYTVAANGYSRWYTHTVTGFVLTPGTYVVATPSPYQNGNNFIYEYDLLTFIPQNNVTDAHLVTDPNFSFGSRRYINNLDGTLQFPTGVDNSGNVGSFGSDLRIAGAVTVPEAGSLALLLPALSLAGASAVRRARKVA